MKKGDKIMVYGKKRAFYKEGGAPYTVGEVLKTTADTVEVMFANTVRPSIIQKVNVTETGRSKKVKGKDGNHAVIKIAREAEDAV